jgi:hypothetical protein
MKSSRWNGLDVTGVDLESIVRGQSDLWFRAYVDTSDVRFKQNITTFRNALQIVLDLKAVSYTFNVTELSNKFTKETQ